MAKQIGETNGKRTPGAEPEEKTKTKTWKKHLISHSSNWSAGWRTRDAHAPFGSRSAQYARNISLRIALPIFSVQSIECLCDRYIFFVDIEIDIFYSECSERRPDGYQSDQL